MRELSLCKSVVVALICGAWACDRGEVADIPEPNELDYLTIRRPLDFKHPAAGLPLLPDGRIAYLEVADSPTGRRYALEDRAGAEASNESSDSVLAELVRRQLSPAEHAALKVGKYGATGRPVRAAGDKLADGLGSRIAREPHEILDVMLRVAEPDRIQVKAELHREIALGEISTWEQYNKRRNELEAQDRAEISEILTPLVAELRAMGFELTYQCHGMYCLQGRAAGEAIAMIARRPDIVAISADSVMGTNQTVDGIDVIDGFQLEQFLPENGGSTTLKGQQVHDGENFPSEKDQVDIRVASIDVAFPENEHLGFREDTGSSDRFDGFYDCDDVPVYEPCEPGRV